MSRGISRVRDGAEPRGARSSSDSEHVAQTFHALLEVLAPLLLSHGITPVRIADIAKSALVSGALSTSLMANGRVNQSKVSAITGLSRIEVRKRLSGAARYSQLPIRALDRSARVVSGWMRDPRFLDNRGQPKRLPLKNARFSFAELVRLHSGDVPPRVVLDQLRLRGLVRVGKHDVALKSKPKEFAGTRPNTFFDVAPYVNDLLSAATSLSARLAYAHKVTISADTPAEEILLTERVVSALAATAAVLSAISSSRRASAPGRIAAKLGVALTLTTERVSAPTSGRPIQKRRNAQTK